MLRRQDQAFDVITEKKTTKRERNEEEKTRQIVFSYHRLRSVIYVGVCVLSLESETAKAEKMKFKILRHWGENFEVLTYLRKFKILRF